MVLFIYKLFYSSYVYVCVCVYIDNIVKSDSSTTLRLKIQLLYGKHDERLCILDEVSACVCVGELINI